MTLTETRKLAKHICRLLKVNEINMPIGRTPKGNLGITFNANNEDFDIMLDSIPLSTENVLDDENNIELKKMIEKYLFTPDSADTYTSISFRVPAEMTNPVAPEPEVFSKKPTKNANTKAKKIS